MQVNGLKFRYINSQCYEFILPNGKHLITDPYITPTQGLGKYGLPPFSVEEIEQCDYILLTHTHYDHTSDIGTLCKKFDAKLFCADVAAMELATYFQVKPGRIYPFTNMETYEMEDFTLKTVRGKHFPMLTVPCVPGSFPPDFGGPKYDMLNYMGTVFTYDFCLTFPNNLRVMFVSGLDESQNIYTVAKKFRPNILFRHTAGSTPGRKWAEIISRFGAQLAFPNHQDNLYNGKWGKTMEDLTAEIQEGLREIGSATQFVNPKPYVWYRVSMGLEEEN